MKSEEVFRMVPGELEFHILCYLAQAGESGGYGWRIKDWLGRKRGLQVRFTTIYRILAAMEAKGLVDSRVTLGKENASGLARKYYRLTEPGRHAFAEAAEGMQELVERLQLSLNEAQKPADSGPSAEMS